MTSSDHRSGKRAKNTLPHPRDARLKKGLSQRDLAKAIPTTQCQVWRYENSGKYPRQVHLRAAYLAVLGLSEKAAP